MASIKLFRDFSLKTSKKGCRLLPSTRHHGALLVLGLICLGLGAEPVVAAEDAVKERFSLYCSVCHGDRGDGASHAQQGLVPPPRDFTDPAFGNTVSRERLVAAITNGVPGTAMIAWQTELSPERLCCPSGAICNCLANDASPRRRDANLPGGVQRLPRRRWQRRHLGTTFVSRRAAKFYDRSSENRSDSRTHDQISDARTPRHTDAGL